MHMDRYIIHAYQASTPTILSIYMYVQLFVMWIYTCIYAVADVQGCSITFKAEMHQTSN